MKALILLVLLICACSTHPTHIDCGARLSPINPPAPASAREQAPGKENSR